MKNDKSDKPRVITAETLPQAVDYLRTTGESILQQAGGRLDDVRVRILLAGLQQCCDELQAIYDAKHGRRPSPTPSSIPSLNGAPSQN